MINDKLLTLYGETMGEKPLDVYPRPQLEREYWDNLNGKWEFSVYKTDDLFCGYKEEILVPFSPECPLSGVKRIVTPDDTAYYRKKFNFTRLRDVVMLHFGAVDYKCTVYLNGKLIGKHRGGYFPFSFDVSDVISDGMNELEVEVTDPTDSGHQAYGKQRLERGGIWYTPQSGIWQTVWIEQTVVNFVKNIYITPDVDSGQVTFDLKFSQKEEGFMLFLYLPTGEARYSSPTSHLTISLNEYLRLWSPEDPFLYNARIITVSGDQFKTYFAMRKISVERTGKFPRIMLNGRPYFQKGLLDQGYWSDGMYTPPSDEAMINDIMTMKSMGFNMLRKHIKIEPLRWYYHCDRLGMLVWQDIVSGGQITGGIKERYPFYEKITGRKRVKKIPKDTYENYIAYGRWNSAGRKEYQDDLVDTVRLLYNSPAVVMWVTFNEAWGQFDSKIAVGIVRALDKTRLIDHASGWFDQGYGDVNSIHNYNKRPWFPKYRKNERRALVLSEYGGLTYSPGKDHVFDDEKSCGYRGFKNAKDCTKAFVKLQKKIKKAIKKKGLCACVYTQVSDVEEELNGILSYDRKVLKLDAESVRQINNELVIPKKGER